MAIKYTHRRLAEREREECERVLLEQMDQQRWFSIALIVMWDQESILPLN